ncbi:MAG: cell division protein FtsQ/DivIB [Candidatus Omnitrophota bacterium]
MKKYKIKFPAKFKKRPVLPSRLVFICVAVLFGVIFAAGYTWRVFRTSDYFKIKDVVCRHEQGIDLSYLKGRNIFAVNLEKQAQYIQSFHPDYKAIKLVRVFPNRIFVYFLKRKPAALVKLYKNFIMDKEGILCNVPADAGELQLPLVVGLETRIFGPSAGKRYNLKETGLILSIIREFERNRAFQDYRIKKIDVKNIGDTSIFLLFPPEAADFSRDNNRGIAYDGLEVKLGQDNIRRKLAILGGVITRGKLDLANIKYIDLRFTKPVIKYGNVK